MSAGREDFLVEIGTEELPPKALVELERAFADGVRGGLEQAALKWRDLQPFATPRRLALLVRGLLTHQPDQPISRRGPPLGAAFAPDGQPTRAAQAFAESCGTTVGALGRVQEPKGEFLFFSGTRAGRPTAELLPGIVQQSLDALPIPKRMRWGSGTAEFVRPVHWVVMCLGQQVLPAEILGVSAGNLTRGHRFMGARELQIRQPASYERRLLAAKVIARFATRRERVRAGVMAAAAEIGGQARALIGEALLDEVTALVEWPVPVTGRFEERFLALPREVLIATLQEHQRYFPVEDAEGRLLPCFITVSNIDSLDAHAVRAGNERVVRPRLSDAAFFWAQDRRRALIERLPELDSVTFQTKLGSLGAKTARVIALATEVARHTGADAALTGRAAALCKCDLLSAMVGEFPELQGTMGRYLALAEGEASEVAEALREHYLPRSAGDALPLTPAGIAVAIADKLDTLAGIFAIGQKPTGARDPFGLRRAAIGVLRILVERDLELDLRALIDSAVRQQPATAFSAEPAAVSAEILAYVLERLRGQYLEGAASVAISTEMFEAVLASGCASPRDFDARLRALAAFLAGTEAPSLTAANKRIANILKKSELPAGVAVREALLVEPAERSLYLALEAIRPATERALARRDYGGALSQLAGLRPAVDAFFDQVLVNDADPARRHNRLALLAALRGAFAAIADLSRLPG